MYSTWILVINMLKLRLNSSNNTEIQPLIKVIID